MTTRMVATVLILGLLLAACAGAPPPTPAAPGTTPTPAAPPAGNGDQPTDMGDEPHMAPDLEQMLPSEVLGSTIRKASLTGEAALSELELDVDLRGAMAAAGGDVSGLQVAIGSPEDSSFVVVAMRVPGVDGAALQTALADSSELPVDQGEIAGKQVTRLGDDQWYYATDEVLFFVVGGVNEANEVIAQLP